MNHTYRLVWNDGCRACIPVGENARTRGKRSGKASTPPVARRLGAIAVAGALLALPLIAQAKSAADVGANALPTGFQVLRGSGSATTTGNVLDVTQNGQRAVFGWNSFDVGTAATVNFKQQAGAVGLNIIGGTDPSFVLGKLNADSNVFFVNPNGMFFGNGASVNVGGLLATTMSMDPDAFMNGDYRLTSPGTGVIRNEGIIKATGGSVALVGNTVQNAGSIYATTVTLAAGNAVAVDLTADGLIRARVEDPLLLASIENSGTIEATAVALTAGQARSMLDRVVNNSGIIRATGLFSQGGEIVLEGGSVTNSGTLAVGTGGTITANADKTLTIAAGSSLTADDGRITLTAGEVANVEKGALIQSNRGNIKLWSDLDTYANGTFRARKGFIETSGKYLDTRGIGIDAAGGTWLLDPTDITIAHNSGNPCNAVAGTCSVSGTTSTINDSDLSSILSSGTSVIIDTASPALGNGNIIFSSNAAILKSGGGDADLKLYADHSISLNGSITSTSNRLNVYVEAGRMGSTGTNSSNGDIGTNYGFTIDTNGGTFTAKGDTIKIINSSVLTHGGAISLTALAQSAWLSAASLRISDNTNPFPTTLNSGGGNISMISAGNIDINGTVNAGAGNLTLNLNGSSASTAETYAYTAITAGGLELLGGANANYIIGAAAGSGGTSVLAPGATKNAGAALPPSTPMKVAGNFNSLSLYVGNGPIGDWVPYSTDIVIGTVNGTSGINATGAVSLHATGGNISQTAAITANSLTANATAWYNSATVDLSHPSNNVLTLAGGVAGAGSYPGYSFKLVNSGPLSITGLVNGGYGGVWIETTSGNVTMGSSGQIKSMLGGTAGNTANSIVVVAGSTTPGDFINNNFYGLANSCNGALCVQNSYGRFLVYAKDVTTSQLYTGSYSPIHAGNGREMETYYGSSFHDTWSSAGAGVPTTGLGTYNQYGSAVIFKNQPTLTVTPDPVSRTYGNANPSFSYTTSGYTTWDAPYSSGAPSGSLNTTATATSGVGNYPIQGTFTSSTGYIVNVAANNSLTIDPRPVSATADAQTKAAGASDPPFTYQITAGSLVNGDTLNLTRNPGETAGSYPIILGSNPNYSVAYTGNALTITGGATPPPPAPPAAPPSAPPAAAPAPAAASSPSTAGGSTSHPNPDTNAAVGAASSSVQSAGSAFGTNGLPPAVPGVAAIPPNGGWNQSEPPPVQPGPPKGRMLVCRNGA